MGDPSDEPSVDQGPRPATPSSERLIVPPVTGDADRVAPPTWTFIPHVLIHDGAEFIVGLDEHYDVDWESRPSFDAKRGKRAADDARIRNQVAMLQAYPIDQLASHAKVAFRSMIAEGLVRVFQDQPAAADEILDKAQKYYAQRSSEAARVWYLEASSAATAVCVLLSVVCFMARGRTRPLLGAVGLELVVCFGAGAVGALLSIFLRVGQSPLEVTAGRKVHSWEAVCRIAAGGIGACLIVFAVKLRLVFPQIIDMSLGMPALLLPALLAGVSERLVPGFVEKLGWKS